MLKKLIHRVKDHWQTTLFGVLILAGYYYFHTGKIDFSDFKEYVIFIPTIILFLMKDWKKKDEV
jgi:hypothetical protein